MDSIYKLSYNTLFSLLFSELFRLRFKYALFVIFDFSSAFYIFFFYWYLNIISDTLFNRFDGSFN